jgi:hypothetical protein
MKDLFSNPALLPLAALIVVPPLVHLLARARPPVFRFPSLVFIRQLLRDQRRLKKPRDWLLLALRTVLFAALIAAFVQPLWFGGRPSPPGAGRNVVLIVDATASMAVREGARSRFAAACAEAADVLAGLNARDRANLIWLRSPPRAVFPQLGVNFGFLRDSLRQGRVSSEAGDPAAALRLAADLLRDADGRREICIVSDFQRTAWSRAGGVPEGIEVVAIPVARAPESNLAVGRITVRPAAPLAGEEAEVYVEVLNYGPAPELVTVQSEIGELHASQPLQVPPWGRAGLAFRARCSESGELTVSARIPEDRLPEDNQAWQVIAVRPSLRVGVLAGAPKTAAYWLQALRALPWAKPVELPATGWAAEAAACDALLLCGWDGAGAEPVLAAMGAGKPVLWYPAPGTPAAAWDALTGFTPPGPTTWEKPREPVGLEVAAPDDPLFAVFAGGERGNPAGGAFAGRLALRAPPEGWNVLLRYRDGVPALARVRKPGSLAIWNLDLDPAVSAWAARMEFLPLFGELLLTSRGASPDDSGARVTGQELACEPGRELAPEEVRLLDPAGAEVPLRSRPGPSGLTFLGGSAEKPGLYTWQLGPDVTRRTAVNVPAEESDLRTVPPPEIKASGWAAVAGGRAARERRDGIPLWPWFLGLALACCVGEGVVAWWASKT